MQRRKSFTRRDLEVGVAVDAALVVGVALVALAADQMHKLSEEKRRQRRRWRRVRRKGRRRRRVRVVGLVLAQCEGLEAPMVAAVDDDLVAVVAFVGVVIVIIAVVVAVDRLVASDLEHGAEQSHVDDLENELVYVRRRRLRWRRWRRVGGVTVHEA